MNAKPFHHAKASGNRSVGHNPHDHMSGFRHERDEIPECVVSGSGLGDLVVRFRFYGMNQIRKLDGVLDEKDGNVIADEVKDAFVRIKLDGETSYVAGKIRGSARSCDSRETHEHGSLPLRILQKIRFR